MKRQAEEEFAKRVKPFVTTMPPNNSILEAYLRSSKLTISPERVPELEGLLKRLEPEQPEKHHQHEADIGDAGGQDNFRALFGRGQISTRAQEIIEFYDANMETIDTTAMFKQFRNELDSHHDRRERIIRASRDITALSKKMISALLRADTVGTDYQHAVDDLLKQVKLKLESIQPDIRGLNRNRYHISGLEEYVEAASLLVYLKEKKLVTPADAAALLQIDSTDGKPFELKLGEYWGGIMDLFGELMRYGTNMVAMKSKLPVYGDLGDSRERSLLWDMQQLGSYISCFRSFQADRAIRAKVDVMNRSIEKVEKLGYELAVRGQELPPGWMEDLGQPPQQVDVQQK